MGTQWMFDPSHTSLAFAVRHMELFTVRGQFTRVSGQAETDEQGRLTSIRAVIEASSIDTGEANRDGHLRSPDFLDAERHPHLTFTSRTVEPLGADRYRVHGELTIRDETRPVTFEVETSGPMTDPYGKRRAGATGTVVLNRRDWELTWNQVLEAGALLVGEEVRLTLDVQAVALEPAAAA